MKTPVTAIAPTNGTDIRSVDFQRMCHQLRRSVFHDVTERTV